MTLKIQKKHLSYIIILKIVKEKVKKFLLYNFDNGKMADLSENMDNNLGANKKNNELNNLLFDDYGIQKPDKDLTIDKINYNNYFMIIEN